MLNVYLYGRLCGRIGFSSSGITRFTFDDEYLGDPRRPTLSQSMLDRHGEPAAPGRSRFGRLPAFFSNLLPEGRLREYLAEHARVDERDEFNLLAALGDDLPGALTVRRADVPVRAPSPRAMTADKPLRFSLAGVQLKFSAFANDDSKGLTIPATGVGGDWIVKMPSRRFDGVPEAEAATMTFAAAVGIDVPEHRLVSSDDIAGLPPGVDAFRTAYAIKRYDRADGGTPIHQEDFAQVLSAYPEEKYLAPSLVPIAETVLEICGEDDAQELIRRVVFCIGVGNGDMHLKNISLYYPEGRDARLAPAYDLLPTARYVRDDTLAVPVVRTKRWEAITEDEFAEFAAAAGLSRHATITAVRATVERMRAAWPAMRATAGFDDLSKMLIERHFERVPLFSGTTTSRPRSPRSRTPQQTGAKNAETARSGRIDG